MRVIANLATHPPRATGLEMVVMRLVPQVDVLNICLNEYDAVPLPLRQIPNVNAVIPDQDKKDTGKFMFECKPDDYIFLVDDDIIYPFDYTKQMIAKIEKYPDLEMAIGVHGIIYSDYYDGRVPARRTQAFYDPVKAPTVVNQIGTGTALVRGRHLPDEVYMVSSAGFVDIRFARYAYENGIALVSVDRPNSWLTPMTVLGPTLFDTVTSAPSSAMLEEIVVFSGYAKLPLDAVRVVEANLSTVAQ
jgi:hypothetical protein